ncbi:MAG: type IX secretion system outer membrane channel protein PorV [Bacteroidales bacterium]|nr:type IX secretion system outer membrane channel protein PorV [Bacteroidales bacterium]
MILKRFAFSFIIVIIALNGFSQSSTSELLGGEANPIHSTVPFLSIAPDSRAGAMGDVGVATKPDAGSQHWNAAKYVFLPGEMGLSLSYTPWLRNLVNDINLAYLNFYKRFDDKQVLSASLLYFSLGDIVFTDNFGGYINTYRPNEFTLDAAYSRLFTDNLSSALTLRFIRSDITGGGSVLGQEYNAGISFAADLAVYYQKDIEIDGKPSQYAWGVSLSNLGTPISYTDDSEKQFIPANLRVGGRLTLDLDDYNNISFATDFNKLLVPSPQMTVDSVVFGLEAPKSLPMSWIQSFYDAPNGFSEEIQEIMISVGAEYWYRDQFAIRAGYFHEHQKKGNRKYFTAGVGLKLNVFSLDFSYLIPTSGRANPLANTMRFTLGLDFDKFREFR